MDDNFLVSVPFNDLSYFVKCAKEVDNLRSEVHSLSLQLESLRDQFTELKMTISSDLYECRSIVSSVKSSSEKSVDYLFSPYEAKVAIHSRSR